MTREPILNVDKACLDSTSMYEKLPAGRYVFLEISDTGRGMDKATDRFTGKGLVSFVQKPSRHEVFLETIHKAITAEKH